MATNKFRVTVCTPDGTVYDKDADLAVLKTGNGQIGILANHIPIVATLDIDEVRVKNDNAEETIAVNGGFVEFSGNIASIVADSAETEETIDVSRAQSAKQRAETQIKHAQQIHDNDELARAEVALKRAINRLKVSGH